MELLFFTKLLKERVFFDFEAVKLLSELDIEVLLVLEVVLQVAVDDIFERGDLFELALELLSEVLLLAQTLCDVALFVSCGLKLAQDHVQALHKRDFVGFELLELVCEICVHVIDLTAHAEVVLGGIGPRGQCRIDRVAWVRSIS